MSGKLKIVRVLANPIGRRKKKKRKATRARKTPRRRKVRSLSGNWVLRIVTRERRALWWDGTSWSKDRKKAKQYPSANMARRHFNSKNVATGWVVADVLPA